MELNQVQEIIKNLLEYTNDEHTESQLKLAQTLLNRFMLNYRPDASGEFWAVVEQTGRRKFVGLVSEWVFAGKAFVRIAVPQNSSHPAFVLNLGPDTLFDILPVSEQIALAVAEHDRVAPPGIPYPVMNEHLALPAPESEDTFDPDVEYYEEDTFDEPYPPEDDETYLANQEF